MDSKGDFAKSSFANQFYELVKVQGRRRELVVLLDILLDVLDQLVSFLEDGVVYFGDWLVT